MLAKNENNLAATQETIQLKIGEIVTYKNGQASLTDFNLLSDSSSSVYDSNITLQNQILPTDTSAYIITNGYIFTINSNLQIINSSIYVANTNKYDSMNFPLCVENGVSKNITDYFSCNSSTKVMYKNSQITNANQLSIGQYIMTYDSTNNIIYVDNLDTNTIYDSSGNSRNALLKNGATISKDASRKLLCII